VRRPRGHLAKRSMAYCAEPGASERLGKGYDCVVSAAELYLARTHGDEARAQKLEEDEQGAQSSKSAVWP